MSDRLLTQPEPVKPAASDVASASVNLSVSTRLPLVIGTSTVGEETIRLSTMMAIWFCGERVDRSFGCRSEGGGGVIRERYGHRPDEVALLLLVGLGPLHVLLVHDDRPEDILPRTLSWTQDDDLLLVRRGRDTRAHVITVSRAGRPRVAPLRRRRPDDRDDRSQLEVSAHPCTPPPP